MSDFFSCDWGTSSFRLRLVAGGNVIAEVRDPFGIKPIFDKAAGAPRENLFSEFLRQKLNELRPTHSPLPLLISGMASSTIGWKELSYAHTPFPLDGTALRFEKLNWSKPPWLGETFLISGLATDRDMMRGEETQILGIMADRAETDCVLILPGTHSKHVQIKNRIVTDFQTFMTGELFEVLSKHSVLRATLDPEAAVQADDAFREGVQAVSQNGLPASLFSVRARGVLAKISGHANKNFLSGLLIGSELSQVRGRVLLAAPGPLADLYADAMKVLARVDWESLPAHEVENAVVRGQAFILK
jgi:2-dehydro-3-deoxygalactonokinase